MAGTGVVSASAGSQMRAARRHPSGIGIQQFSMTRTAWGKRSMIFIDAPLALHYTGFLLVNLKIFLGRGLPLRGCVKVQRGLEPDFRIHVAVSAGEGSTGT